MRSSRACTLAYSIPTRQTNITSAINQGSATMRNTPDVGLDSRKCLCSGWRRHRGWDELRRRRCGRAFWRWPNQRLPALAIHGRGFLIQPSNIIGTGPKLPLGFTTSRWATTPARFSPNRFYAVPGYDLCTGWGSPNGQPLSTFCGIPEILVSPGAGFSSIGAVGGRFSVNSETFSVRPRERRRWVRKRGARRGWKHLKLQ